MFNLLNEQQVKERFEALMSYRLPQVEDINEMMRLCHKALGYTIEQTCEYFYEFVAGNISDDKYRTEKSDKEVWHEMMNFGIDVEWGYNFKDVYVLGFYISITGVHDIRNLNPDVHDIVTIVKNVFIEEFKAILNDR